MLDFRQRLLNACLEELDALRAVDPDIRITGVDLKRDFECDTVLAVRGLIRLAVQTGGHCRVSDVWPGVKGADDEAVVA